MITDWTMQVYWRLPVSVQETALTLYARRLDKLYYGPSYQDWRRRFHEWQSWSHADAAAWQSDRLRLLIDRAATTVPYYRGAWRRVDWKAVDSPGNLGILPVLDKQTLRQHEQAFLVDGLDPKSLWTQKTSGTTGTALRIYWPSDMLPKWWALCEVAVRNIAGVAQHIPRAMMGGRPIIAGATQRPPYWRFNRLWRQLYLSSYHVSDSTAPHYAKAVREYGSEWITGYGSAIAALAESALTAGVEPVRLRSAIVSGDTLLPGMRTSIEQFFQCRCFDHYGQSEGVCSAMECPYGRMHVIPFAGIIEILRQDGTACAPGEVGEIVATGLLNDAMPLIRYRLGDYAAWAGEQDCPCGNQQPILTKLEGRVDDYLLTADGRKIGRLSTAMKRSPTIHSAQIVQDRPGHAYLLVRPSEGYRTGHALAVRDDIQERIGRFDLDVREVTEIPKTLRGKTSLVVRLMEQPLLRPAYRGILN
ncbi:phenylacetate--CoA ligase family protein [Candidatus Nitrospira bockiana]